MPRCWSPAWKTRRAGTVDVYVTSDRMEDARGKLAWTVTTVTGEKLREGSLDINVPCANEPQGEFARVASEA